MATTTKNMQVVAGNANASVTAQVTDSMPGVPCPGPAGYTYKGLRYVPVFADPAEWSSANSYEALTIVLHEGNSYTSKQAVPVGIDISNETFWALTGNYNAQVEQYRQEVKEVSDRLKAVGGVTPEMFGAKGDGVTDDSAAVQAAFQFPFVTLLNTYMVKSNIDASKVNVLRGAREGAGFNIWYLEGDAHRAGGYRFTFSGIEGLVIENVTFTGTLFYQGNETWWPSNDTSQNYYLEARSCNLGAIRLQDCPNAKITGCVFNDVVWGVFSTTTNGANINGLTVNDCVFNSNGGVISSYVDEIHCSGNTFNVTEYSNPGFHSYYIQDGEGVTITGDVIKVPVTSIYQPYDFARYDTLPAQNQKRRIVVSNCYVRSQRLVYTRTPGATSFSNCIFDLIEGTSLTHGDYPNTYVGALYNDTGLVGTETTFDGCTFTWSDAANELTAALVVSNTDNAGHWYVLTSCVVKNPNRIIGVNSTNANVKFVGCIVNPTYQIQLYNGNNYVFLGGQLNINASYTSGMIGTVASTTVKSTILLNGVDAISNNGTLFGKSTVSYDETLFDFVANYVNLHTSSGLFAYAGSTYKGQYNLLNNATKLS